jgi:hypothetical protein
MLLPVLRQAFTPHEYGLHLASAGSPLASSRIAFVSYGLSFPLPLLPTPPHGDAVTVEYKPERLVWRELSSLDMFAPTGALAQAARLRWCWLAPLRTAFGYNRKMGAEGQGEQKIFSSERVNDYL